MKIIRILVIALISAASLKAADTLTLGETVEIALRNNYAIRLSEKSVQIAENNESPGKAGMLPGVNASAGYQKSSSNVNLELATGQNIESDGAGETSMNAGIQMNWTLFDGMAMFTNYKRLGKQREQSDIELQLAIKNTIRGLARNYYNALLLRENLRIARQNLSISQERYNRVMDRNEFGSAAKIEILSAQVDLNTDSSNVSRTELQLESLKRSINFLIGRSPNEEFDLASPRTNYSVPPLNEFREKVFAANDSILLAMNNRELSELNKSLVYSSFWPRISASASYNYVKSESDASFLLLNETTGWSVGVNAQWNLFNGMQKFIDAQNAEIMNEMSEIGVQQAKMMIDMSASTAYDNYQRQQEILELEKSSLQTAEENFSRTEELFELGQATSLQLREAQLNLARQQQRINSAEFDLRMSEIELQVLAGEVPLR
jgi:outer membrane protein TolC